VCVDFAWEYVAGEGGVYLFVRREGRRVGGREGGKEGRRRKPGIAS
jgi:hypothetical protein